MSTFLQGAATTGVRRRSETAYPAGRLLSNGRYSVLITRAGTGTSRWCDQALTRWTPDRLEDREGLVVWLREGPDGAPRSLGHAPAGRGAGRYDAGGEPGRFSIVREDDGLEAVLEVVVDPERDAELRRVRLTNRSSRPRRVQVTTAAEVVLHQRAADASHPAFSKLFVQTEYDAARRALLARRRPRGPGESHPVMVHALLEPGETAWESDRLRFVGRDGSAERPIALMREGGLSGTTGDVLDPLVALSRTVELAPGACSTLTFVLGVAPDRDGALALVDALASPGVADRAFERAVAQAHAVARAAGIEPEAAIALQALASAMLYRHPALRPEAGARIAGESAPALNGLAPPRHVPLVLVEPASGAPAPDLAALAAARRYWGSLGVEVAVWVLAHEALPAAPEGVRVVPRAEFGPDGLATLRATAALVLDRPLDDAARATLAGESIPPPAPPLASAAAAAGMTIAPEAHARHDDGPATNGTPPTERLLHFNGFGGFTADGAEYVIRMPWEGERGLRKPPNPWVNVIAQPGFGFLVSETGAGSAWGVNSREHRLTPWANDPVLDPHGEALYLRDEASGAWWSLLAGPAPQPVEHEMRHGFGYSTARHTGAGLEQEVTLFALADEPARVARVRITNRGERARRLALYGYQRLVLGVLPEDSGRFVVTAYDPDSGLLLARNPMAGEFADRVAFAGVVAPEGASAPSVTADREAFLGLGGSPARPLALAHGTPLDGATGAGLDPCFAQRFTVEVEPGATVECSFVLGEAGSEAQAREILTRLRGAGEVGFALEAAQAFWREFVSGVRIETPSPELDLMVNGWLAYQTLSCRIWGRTAFYQSGGAFGFRDQLQDAASLLHLRPGLLREQLLLHAAHQFVEGDVLHWWHPPLAKGIRTRFADDLLWLPLLAAYYASSSGDWGVFDERVRFLEAEPLAPGVDEAYLVPSESGRSASLYEHCCRALDRSLTLGVHGLPLFGTGDWNDGMNRVGREGRGESVWMGFFLHAILGDFGPACERRGDVERAERYARHRDRLRAALNDAGWDGGWYLRAFYDNGQPMGSHSSDECRIDGLAQAWAVISHAAPPERVNAALDAVERELVSERDGLVRLLTPPFRDTPNDPGYIKGYVAGVRENGGQYTHAAMWVVRAFAEAGRTERATRLLAMLSPVHHARDRAEAMRYRVEPYAVAADVYGQAPHVGRGGWTWYTGSSGWMLRVAIESILGIELEQGETLVIRPRTPGDWREYRVAYRPGGGATSYEILFRREAAAGEGVVGATLDGASVPIVNGAARIPIYPSGRRHRVVVRLAAGSRNP